MMELLTLYWEAILCSALAAMALSWLGIHLTTRDLALQSLALSQGTTLAAVIGAALVGFYSPQWWWVYLMAICGGVLVSFVSASLITSKRLASPNTYLLSLYMLLLAATYWVISYFPSLESHLSQAFMGDLVTLAGGRMALLALVSLVGVVMLGLRHRSLSQASVREALFGQAFKGEPKVLFVTLSLLLVVTSIFTLGLLFTISFLFFPTLAFAWKGQGTLRRHHLEVTLLAPVAAVAGFVVSLSGERLSTVPTIVMTLFVLCLVARFAKALSALIPR